MHTQKKRFIFFSSKAPKHPQSIDPIEAMAIIGCHIPIRQSKACVKSVKVKPKTEILLLIINRTITGRGLPA